MKPHDYIILSGVALFIIGVEWLFMNYLGAPGVVTVTGMLVMWFGAMMKQEDDK